MPQKLEERAAWGFFFGPLVHFSRLNRKENRPKNVSWVVEELRASLSSPSESADLFCNKMFLVGLILRPVES